MMKDRSFEQTSIMKIQSEKMTAAFSMYSQRISIHFHFGYTYLSSSKDFIK